MWTGAGGPVTIAPMFLLYDYSFRPEGARTKDEALAIAYETGVFCSDESVLHPDPYESREAWCWERIEVTERHLGERDQANRLAALVAVDLRVRTGFRAADRPSRWIPSRRRGRIV